MKHYSCFTNLINERIELEERWKQLEAEQLEIEKRNEINLETMEKLE